MTAPAGILSGWCGQTGWHGRCFGSYAGRPCVCDCHTQPAEPEKPVEPRRVQVRRGEVWRTDPDGSWRALGTVKRGDHAHLDDAVMQLLAELDVDPSEYQP